MSSRITSPFGTLGARVAASAASDAGRQAPDAEAPPPQPECIELPFGTSWVAQPPDRPGAEDRPVGLGRWVEYHSVERGWQPALLIAWRRYGRQEPWWARLVIVSEPGLAIECLVLGDLVRPITTTSEQP